MAVEGIRSMTAYCGKNNIPHEICGKLVVAADPSELPRMEALLERGKSNGLLGLEQISPDQAKKIEPGIRCAGALRVPQEGIVDYSAVARSMVQDIKALGGRIWLATRVSSLQKSGKEWRVGLSAPGSDRRPGLEADSLKADLVINCGGLQCDRIARLSGYEPQTRIVPFRGQYFRLHPRWHDRVKNLIYPVPNPELPFLGVHLTRMIHGGIEVGPNAFLALGRESYRFLNPNFPDLWDALTFAGLWRFLAKFPTVSFHELLLTLSRRVFARELGRLVPGILPEDLLPGISGIRAQAMRQDGTLVQDFDLAHQPGMLHVLNAPSPGATASLAIAGHLVGEAQKALEQNP
jgi:L-2-hydroxyglutarate oxidase LhgO